MRFIIPIIIAIIIIIIIAIVLYNRKIENIKRYREIEIGMPEDEMLEIMGDRYTKSLLKNNRVKYEWRINGSSYGYYYKGVSSRSYSGVKKATVYVKDGLVEEVKGLNLD